MCGITVYFNTRGITHKELDENLSALKSIRHRGPDGEGVVMLNVETGETTIIATDETPQGVSNAVPKEKYREGSAHLFIGHRRLSIIDTSIKGHQPMLFNERYWISFNGEIYNYVELRKELTELGYQFITGSDTEVALAAYDKWGASAVPKFNGMFAIVIYDLKEKTLFVVNDRYGVKPLFYYEDSQRLILMSEVKEIKNYNVPVSINEKYLGEFLHTSYLDYDQQTVYKEVKRFKPSHFAKISLTKRDREPLKQEAYYLLNFKQQKISTEDAIAQFNTLFNRAVNLRLRSDVPLGCSLSGGLDSSSILVRAIKELKSQDASGKFNTFSVVFPQLDGDESRFIEIMTNHYNVNSHYVNALDKFNLDDFEKHVYHQDFPVQTTSYYAEWCLAREVRSAGITVLLNGQGGDELLAGYHHHFYRYCRQLIMSGKIIKYLVLEKQFAELKGMPVDRLHRLVINEVKLSVKFKLGLAKLGSSLSEKWSKADTLTKILRLDFTEFMLPTYLRSDDRDFMAWHVETRHPFLDFNLVDFCNTLPNDLKIRDGWQKWILREAMVDMPGEIRYRKDKKGYTTPQEVWLKKFHKEFENYLDHLPTPMRAIKTSDPFLKYSLGAWFKTNNLN